MTKRILSGVIALDGDAHSAYLGRVDEFETLEAFSKEVQFGYESDLTVEELVTRGHEAYFRVCVCRTQPGHDDYDYHFEEYPLPGRGRFKAYFVDNL